MSNLMVGGKVPVEYNSAQDWFGFTDRKGRPRRVSSTNLAFVALIELLSPETIRERTKTAQTEGTEEFRPQDDASSLTMTFGTGRAELTRKEKESQRGVSFGSKSD